MNGLLAIEDLAILTLRTTTGDLPFAEIDHRSCMEQEVHPEDSVDREPVFHRPHFDPEVLYSKTPKGEILYSFGEDELCTSDASNATDRISVFEMQIDVQQLIRGEHSASRAGIQQDVLQLDTAAAVSELCPDEGKPADDADLTHRGCPANAVR